jgi:competence ComEA-like helix-hairpin-helix protein
MNWQEFVKDYFIFTRKERIGISAILLLVIAIWISPRFISPGKSSTKDTDTSWMAEALKLEHSVKELRTDSGESGTNVDDLVYERSVTSPSRNTKRELFYFDPNILSREGWQKLGVREKTIATIQNYLNKGGHFYKADDLKKIYGIDVNDFSRWEPYIRIQTKDDSFMKPKFENKKEQLSKKPGYNVIDINSADTTTLIALPGIGSKLASRIISFRDKLGGFYSIDQIIEIYGLPDSTFQKIKPYLKLEKIELKKININTATKDEMKSHPYMKWSLANAIVEYRNQHGNFSSLEDLKKISLITDELFDKLKPYLDF